MEQRQAWGLVRAAWDLVWLPSLACCPATITLTISRGRPRAGVLRENTVASSGGIGCSSHSSQSPQHTCGGPLFLGEALSSWPPTISSSQMLRTQPSKLGRSPWGSEGLGYSVAGTGDHAREPGLSSPWKRGLVPGFSTWSSEPHPHSVPNLS